MLSIIVPGKEHFNEETQEFETRGDVVLHLEHSLASLSKWESIWEEPFLSNGQRTTEQLISYVECMCVCAVSSSEVFSRLTEENVESINAYLDSKQSATRITEIKNQAPSREVVTSELIYYWMVSYRIPFECDQWNLNRLFTLIRICGIKNTKQKPMSKAALAARNRELNAQRRQQLGTNG